MEIEKLTPLEKLLIIRSLIERGDLLYDDERGKLIMITCAKILNGNKIKVY